MKLKAHAKINLFLNVLAKRPDGYHDIHTLFERISLWDDVRLTLAPSGIRLKCSSKEIPSGPSNLAYRAARLLKDEYGIQKGVRIHITKRIPVSAGLGGGSSDAAAVLLGLNRLWKLNLSQKELSRLGARLGSDVAFFVLDTSFALGSGRGEVLKKIQGPRWKIWHCLVKPTFGISTAEAYSALRPPFLTPQKTNAKMLFHSIHEGQPKRLAKLLINSLEVVLNKRVTEISKIKNELNRLGALGSLMSGSGSAVFGVFSSKQKALKAARHLKKVFRNFDLFVVSSY